MPDEQIEVKKDLREASEAEAYGARAQRRMEDLLRQMKAATMAAINAHGMEIALVARRLDVAEGQDG